MSACFRMLRYSTLLSVLEADVALNFSDNTYLKK